MTGVQRLRGTVAEAIRSRVGGWDRRERERRTWYTLGQRWFGPEDPVWQVHKDPAMFIGGLRALVMQSLHPLAMAGVDQHSGCRGRPVGRLQRTSLFIGTTTHALITDTETMIRAVRTVRADSPPRQPAPPDLTTLRRTGAVGLDPRQGELRGKAVS